MDRTGACGQELSAGAATVVLMPIIEAEDLRKTYRTKKQEVQALDGLNLTVDQGTVKAVLGPNGAGKTTTVRVLTTLLVPDSGRAVVDGKDVLAEPRSVRSAIGVSGQYASIDEELTGTENLVMVGQLYHLSKATSQSRARDLLQQFDLQEAGDRPVKGFSGGMRRRIDLACAVVNEPRVLFLDEPTTGLDPRSRTMMWDVIRDLVGRGTTVLLTTQYLEEADQLADHISVVDTGKVIAEGTADQLKAHVGGHRVEVTLVDGADAAAAREVLSRHGSGEVHLAPSGRTLGVSVAQGPRELSAVLAELREAGVALHDAGMRRPTLDDVFLNLTGHSAESATDEEETA